MSDGLLYSPPLHTHTCTLQQPAPLHADLAMPLSATAVSSQQQEVVDPGEWVGRGSRLMLQSWRFVVVWLTLLAPGPFLRVRFCFLGLSQAQMPKPSA